MAQNMGIGHLGFSNLTFKRKFRWTFAIDCCKGYIPPYYVKLAARPSLTVEETEINYLNAKTWIPGKASWETITVTYIDAATSELQNLYQWLASVYDFTRPISLNQGSSRKQYAGQGYLSLWDGCGNELEQWVLDNVWPQAVNFGDLDYASSDEITIELTLRYSDVSYKNICPGFQIENCCGPCDGSSGGYQQPNFRTVNTQ